MKLKHLNIKIFWGLLALAILFTGSIWASWATTIHNSIASTHQVRKAKRKRSEVKTVKAGKPINILLLGTDTGELNRHYKGRTDTIIIATLNPEKKEMLLTSIPRDLMIQVTDQNQTWPTKLNAAYTIGGVDSTISTLQEHLNIPIDYYALVNMGGLEKVIDQVGGIEVTPKLTFTYEGATFTKGQAIKMNGATALKYSRMRKLDPAGDYGRQERQREIIAAVAKKLTNVTTVANSEFIKTLSSNLKTDLNISNALTLAKSYWQAKDNIQSDHLQGTSQMYYGQSFEIDGTAERQRITDRIRSELALPHAKTGSSFNEMDVSQNQTNTQEGETH